jgi:branched-chain amino acid transport system permease protein
MKRSSIFAVIGALVIFYIVIPYTIGGNLYVMSLVVASLTIGGIALAWALLGNLGGMVSFGHAAFFGVGSYVSALLTLKSGWPIFPAMLAAGIGTLVASIVMLPALRLRGPYFALAILAYAHIFRILATEFESVTEGSSGLTSIPRLPVFMGIDFGSKIGSYYIILTIVLIFVIIYSLIRNSYYGLALKAMHDSEDATRVVGVNSTLLKTWMLAVSAFMTGVVGAFNAHYINFLEPDYAFSSSWTVLPIIAAIFGGYRTIIGPLVGALVVYLVDQLIFKSLIPIGHEIMLGALLAAMIILSPTGLVPLITTKLKRRPDAAT